MKEKRLSDLVVGNLFQFRNGKMPYIITVMDIENRIIRYKCYFGYKSYSKIEYKANSIHTIVIDKSIKWGKLMNEINNVDRYQYTKSKGILVKVIEIKKLELKRNMIFKSKYSEILGVALENLTFMIIDMNKTNSKVLLTRSEFGLDKESFFELYRHEITDLFYYIEEK